MGAPSFMVTVFAMTTMTHHGNPCGHVVNPPVFLPKMITLLVYYYDGEILKQTVHYTQNRINSETNCY